LHQRLEKVSKKWIYISGRAGFVSWVIFDNFEKQSCFKSKANVAATSGFTLSWTLSFYYSGECLGRQRVEEKKVVGVPKQVLSSSNCESRHDQACTGCWQDVTAEAWLQQGWKCWLGEVDIDKLESLVHCLEICRLWRWQKTKAPQKFILKLHILHQRTAWESGIFWA
jgi:hypothetical protein